MTTTKQTPSTSERFAAWLPALTVLLAVAYITAAYLLLLLPVITKLLSSGSSEHLAQLRQQVTADRAYSTALEEQVRDFRMLNTERKAKVHRVMPLAPEAPQLFVMFDTLARGSGMRLDSIDTSVDASGTLPGRVVPVRVSLNVSGAPFPQFRAWLREVERNERISDVSSVMFSPRSGSYSIVLHTYHVDASAAAPARAAR